MAVHVKVPKPEVARMMEAAREAVKTGAVKVVHIPTGKRGASLTHAQWDQITKGEKKFGDFSKKRGRPKKAA